MTSSRPSSAATGSSPAPKLPGYSISDRLGSGSYATVYRALSLAPGSSGVRETVAVKCISRRRTTENRIIADNLIQEVAILKKLRHRHIVQLKDFQWDDEYIYLVMEYCNAGDLSRFIRTHRQLPERVARKFLRQLASAMYYLHSQDIAHMDLKPHNLLLTRTGMQAPVLKVADFGFAQTLHKRPDDWDPKDFRGSLLYMAPEIYKRIPYDSSVDLWSIGVILYECLYGVAPFACTSETALIKHLLSEAPITLPERNPPLSESCTDLLKRLLVRDPRRRLSFDEFFNHDFVDIQTAPCEQSTSLADAAVRDADAARRRGNHATAVKHYTCALDHYLAALQYVDTDRERERLRALIRDVLQRAESSKQEARPVAETPRQQLPMSDFDTIRKQWADTPQINAALVVAEAAQELEKQQRWAEALDKYTLAVEACLVITSREAQSRRRQPLRAHVERWLTRAEQLRTFAELDELHLSDVQNREAEVLKVEDDAAAVANEGFGSSSCRSM